MGVACQHLSGTRPARGVQIQGVAHEPHAKSHEAGRVRTQRVWIYEGDYKELGITEDCGQCQHNQGCGYNKSRMIHPERCRTRMETALATTEAGQKRLAAAEGRKNQRLAQEIEEADARPERGIETAVPYIKVDDDLFGDAILPDPLTQPGGNATLSMASPAAGLSTQRGARRQAAEKPRVRERKMGRARDKAGQLWRERP